MKTFKQFFNESVDEFLVFGVEGTSNVINTSIPLSVLDSYVVKGEEASLQQDIIGDEVSVIEDFIEGLGEEDDCEDDVYDHITTHDNIVHWFVEFDIPVPKTVYLIPSTSKWFDALSKHGNEDISRNIVKLLHIWAVSGEEYWIGNNPYTKEKYLALTKHVDKENIDDVVDLNNLF